jgi:regulator of protease activity HflC (stomatin/prohibitin superfamily)
LEEINLKHNNDFARGEAAMLIGIFGVIMVVLMVVGGCFTVVPAGNVGVADTFGVVDANVLQPGLHIKLPWTGVTMMSGQTQKYMDYGSVDTATITALSNEGLSVSMAIAVNYHLDTTKATEVYKTVGPNYQNIVMVNPIHAVPRDIISKYDAKTLYSAAQSGSADRAKIENELYSGIQDGINKGGVKDSVVIEQVFIREIKLPQTLMESIAMKLSMEQQIAMKQFEVQKQDAESNRMRSEARGIADANQIISGSLTQAYLEWYGIEMMKSHTGATYFIPVDSTGRYNPQTVLPLDGKATESNYQSDLVSNLRNNVNRT